MKDDKTILEDMLTPGGGAAAYETIRKQNKTLCGGWFAYALFSSIKLAIRERADDQARSTERADISRASAVSAVVKPAK